MLGARLVLFLLPLLIIGLAFLLYVVTRERGKKGGFDGDV